MLIQEHTSAQVFDEHHPFEWDMHCLKLSLVRRDPARVGGNRWRSRAEELQLHPEQSTDAFVLYHPEAKYFNV